MITVVHPTVRPKMALGIKEHWLDMAKDPSSIEYIFAIDDIEETKEILKGEHTVSEPYRLGNVNKINLGTRHAKHPIIVVSSDDTYAGQDWDFLIKEAIPNTNEEVVLDINDGHVNNRPDLLHGFVFTKKYFERRGWFLHPEFKHVYADDFLVALALKDGVIRIARNILLEHRHWSHGGHPLDEHYSRCSTPEHYSECLEVFNRLCAEYGVSKNHSPLA